jgi:hypothetical protein
VLLAAVQAWRVNWVGDSRNLGPLYLVCGRKIGRVGATDRPRPWSIKKTAKKSLVHFQTRW